MVTDLVQQRKFSPHPAQENIEKEPELQSKNFQDA